MKIPADKKCALCTSPLAGKNRTKEHIIPNAIGGRKKTIGFICNDCNNKLGESWDSELARQLNWFSLAIGISRERGEPPKQIVQTTNGEKYWLLSDGSLTPEKSSYNEKECDEGIKISLSARTHEEVKQRLKGILRKYPKFDIDKAQRELQLKSGYLESPLQVNLSLGGPDAGRSLVKTAFAFASECGVPHNQCEKALEYLLDNSTKTIPFGFAYLSDLVEVRPNDRVFHCVSLHADPKSKRLWSYIEYFGLFRVVVLLSEEYKGPFKRDLYALDPITGNSIEIKIKEWIDDEEFSLLMDGQGLDQEKHKNAANYAIPIIMQRNRERSLERTLKEGVQHAAKTLKLKDGEVIPKEKAAEFTRLVMEKVSPYISYLLKSACQQREICENELSDL